MSYEANLIPVDESLFSKVLIPFVMGNDACDQSFNQYLIEAIRIHRVQRRTQMMKRQAMNLQARKLRAIKSSQSNAANSGQDGDSEQRNFVLVNGATLGDESPSASLLTDSYLPESYLTESDGRHGRPLPQTKNDALTSMMSRPFFIPTDPSVSNNTADMGMIGDAYTRYRLAKPQDANNLARDLCSGAGFTVDLEFDQQIANDSSALPVVEPSDDVVSHELSWKMRLLGDAYKNLSNLRAVFDQDGELYHPHQLLSEESPMILVEFASRLNPGWSVPGPLNPSQLINRYATQRTDLFVSPTELFAPLTAKIRNLNATLNAKLDVPYQVGSYLPSDRLPIFIEVVEFILSDHLAKHPIEAQHSTALTVWLEAACYSQSQNLGLIETANLYSQPEGILN